MFNAEWLSDYKDSEIESLKQERFKMEALLQQKQDEIDALQETVRYYQMKEEYSAN